MTRTTNKVSITTTDASPRTGFAARIAGRSLLAACVAAAVVLASCSKEPETAPLPGGERAISIRTTLGGTTDATNTDAANAAQAPGTGHATDANAQASGTTAANAQASATKATRSPVTDGGAGAAATLADMHFLRRDGATMQTNFSDVTALTASRNAQGGIVFAAGSVPTYDFNDQNVWFTAYWPTTAANGATVTAGSSVVWAVDGSRDILLSTLDPAVSFDAGKYSSPGTQKMTLEHALAQLQVICTADASTTEAAVRKTWGKITRIEILSSPATATYTYSSNTLSYGAAAAAMPLWTADYTAKFEGQTYELTQNNTAVTAAGMYPPSTGAVRLKVFTETVPAGAEVSVQLNDSSTPKDFERGLTHTVILTFGTLPEKIALTGTTITPWKSAESTEVEIK